MSDIVMLHIEGVGDLALTDIREAPDRVGDMGRAFSSRLRSDTRATAHAWACSTSPLDYEEARALKARLSSPRALVCNGVMFDFESVLCRARQVQLQHISPTFAVVQFTLDESNPARAGLRHYGGRPWAGAFARDSAATYTDRHGIIRSAVANEPRWQHYHDGVAETLLEPAGSNPLTNPNGVGAVAGVLGSGGALPTNWSLTEAPTGITVSVVEANAVRDGVRGVVLRAFGTRTGGAAQIRIGLNNTASLSVISGQTNALSFFFALDADTGAQSPSHYRSDPTRHSAADFTPSGAVQRVRHVATATSSGGTQHRLRIGVEDGHAVDVVFFVGGPQAEVNTQRVSSLMRPSGDLVQATPRAVDILTRDLTGTPMEDPHAEWTLYLRWRAGMAGDGGLSGPRVMQIGADGARQGLYWASATSLRWFHAPGTGALSEAAITVASAAEDDIMEAILPWRGGAATEWHLRRNGVSVGSAPLAALNPATEWDGAALAINSTEDGSNAGVTGLRAAVGIGGIVRGTAPEVHDFMAGY